MKRWSWICLLALVSLVMTLAGPTLSAHSANELSVILVKVQDDHFPIVTVNMVVNDANGWPVTTLTAKNFTVTEDKQSVAADKVTVENVNQQPLTAVLALDVSVDKPVWPLVQEAANQLISTLGPEDKLAIVTFANNATVLQDFTSDVGTLKNALAEATPGGSFTALYEGVGLGLDQLADVSEGRRALILLSDSTDNAHTTTLEDVVFKAQQAKIPIFTVGYGPKVVNAQFKELSTQTGNQALIFNTVTEVGPQLRLLSLALHQGYQLTFVSAVSATEGDHTFAITIKNPDGSGQISGEFVAKPGQITVSGPGFDVTQPVVGRIFLIANVQASAQIKQVEYWLDDALLGQVTEVPYSFDLDASTLFPGSHHLLIRAEDIYGNTGESESDFIVAQPPPISIKLTASATTVEQGNKIIVTALPDSVGQVKSVTLWVDGVALEPDTVAPYVWELDSNKFSVGDHVVQAQVEDSRGEVDQDAVSIKIQAPVLQTWTKYAGIAFGWLGVVVLVVLTFVLPINLFRNFKGKIQGKYLLEVENLGNVTSRYDLQLNSEPAGLLKASFIHAGQALGTHKMVDTGAQAAPAKKGFFNRQPAEKPAPTPEQEAAAEKRNNALRVFGALWDAFTEIIRSLMLIVGGPVGNALRTVSMQATRAEYVAGTTQRIGYQANRVGQVVSGNQENGGSTQETTTAKPVKILYLPGEWAQTPEISAGEKLTLELVVTPLKSAQSQTYTFRVLTRATVTPDLEPNTERTTVEIKGLAWWQNALPWALTLLLLVTILISSLFLLSQMM